jgi:hypothetical protein
VRRNFWPGLRFADLADLNRQALEWLESTANVRIHGTTGEVPYDRLPLEHLQSIVDKPDYGTSLMSFRRPTKDCLVSYDGNYYSVPWEYARKTLKLKETEAGQLISLNPEDDDIARHRVPNGHHQRLAITAHYENMGRYSRPSGRPMAMQVLSSEVLTSLPAAPGSKPGSYGATTRSSRR